MEEKCIETIKNLCKKYEGNSYMLQRIDSHINTYLEATLQNEEQNHEKRIVRTNTLTHEQQIFIQVFSARIITSILLTIIAFTNMTTPTTMS